MQGSPPNPPVTSDDWITGPNNRWGFLHVRELAKTARIWRGDGPVRILETHLDDAIPALSVTVDDETMPLRSVLDRTYTDGLCVVHDGRIVFEHYTDGMERHDIHLLMSVSKSLTASLVGVLVGQGKIDPDDLVTSHISELAGTSFDGCTVQHLLDMRAGTRFDEDDYNDPNSDGVLIEQVCGYTTRQRDDLPTDTYAWIMSLPNDREHGSAFKYRSILTDVLGWVAERAAGMRFADLFSREIWSKIGAEEDAAVIVDDAGFAIVEGGICTSLRDLARFGLMHLERGVVGEERIVPAEWIDRLTRPMPELVEAYGDYWEGGPVTHYHDKWWVWDADAGRYSGYGINGQQLLIDRSTDTVIARFSTWPDRFDEELIAWGDAANRAILDHLGG